MTDWSLENRWGINDVLGFGTGHVLATGSSGTRLPLDGPCADLGLAPNAVLGRVQADGSSVVITGTCDPADPNSVHLHPAPFSWRGRSYTGTLTIGTGEHKSVALTLNRTMNVWLVVGLMLVGVVIALGVTHWTGTGREVAIEVRHTFLIDGMVSAKNKDNPDTQFAKLADDLGLPPNVRGWTIAPAVNSATAAARAKLRGSPSSDDLAKIKADLTALSDRVRTWPGVANSLATLRARSARLDKAAAYEKYVDSKTFDRQLADGGALLRADIDSIATVADEAVGVTGDIDLGTLQLADQLMNEHAELTEAEDLNKAFGKLGAVTTAAEVRSALVEVSAAYLTLRTAVDQQGAQAMYAVAPDALPTAGGGGLAVFAGLATVDPLEHAAQQKVRIWLIDRAVFIVLLVAAIVGGLQTLWVGKQFGSPLDVLVALAWGLGATAVTGALAGAVGNLRKVPPGIEGS